MEEFSYRQSPREFLVTRNNEATPPRLNNDYRSCSFASAFQHENLSLTVTTILILEIMISQELKKEHSKALNTIEILKLEKNNLEVN